MAVINVVPLSGAPNYKFEVTVAEGASRTTHTVTMAAGDYGRYAASRAGGFVQPEQIVETAFRFLLEREPKESILRKFDITVISRYFPDFERILAGML